MIQFLLFLLSLIFTSLPAFSQLYFAKKGGTNYYVEVSNDGAYVEAFTRNSHTFEVYKHENEFLNPWDHESDTIFSGKRNLIFKTRNSYLLVHGTGSCKKGRTIRLEPCLSDERNVLRNQAYVFDLRLSIHKLENKSIRSNQPPATSILSIEGESYLNELDKNLPDSLYKLQADKLGDSLKAILFQRDTLSRNFYYAKDSIKILDSATVFRMLSIGNYNFINSYSNDFLYHLSVARPEDLIIYLDGDPENKIEILNAIRNHVEYKEIIENVKRVETNSAAKMEVIRQKGKRTRGDIVAATSIALLIVAEITGLIFLGALIF